MFAFVRGFSVLLFLTILVFIVNFCQLLSVVTIPFSRPFFDRFNMGIKQFYCGTLARGALMCGNRVDVVGEVPRIENAILMANHQAYLDIPVLWMWLVDTPIIGWMKWFVKDEFKYVPGLGWGLKFVHALFVKRTWSKDAESIKNTFGQILDLNLPYWVTIFPRRYSDETVKI